MSTTDDQLGGGARPAVLRLNRCDAGRAMASTSTDARGSVLPLNVRVRIVQFGCRWMWVVRSPDLQGICIVEALSLPPTPSSLLGSDVAGRGQWTTITPMTRHILVFARCVLPTGVVAFGHISSIATVHKLLKVLYAFSMCDLFLFPMKMYSASCFDLSTANFEIQSVKSSS